MYEKFTCKRCNHEFDMTDEKRPNFVKNGGCTIECPKCGSCGLERTLDRRKLNDVFTVPKGKGLFNIYGVIGSGKTRDEVMLQDGVELQKMPLCVVEWRHRIGKLWRVLEPLTENGGN